MNVFWHPHTYPPLVYSPGKEAFHTPMRSLFPRTRDYERFSTPTNQNTPEKHGKGVFYIRMRPYPTRG